MACGTYGFYYSAKSHNLLKSSNAFSEYFIYKYKIPLFINP